MMRKTLTLSFVVLLSISWNIENSSKLFLRSAQIPSSIQQSASQEITDTIYLPILENNHDRKNVQNWTEWYFETANIMEIYAGSQPGEVWIVTFDKLYASNDYGYTWRLVNIGNDLPAYLAYDKNSGTGFPIYLATRFGPVLSSLDGSTWIVDRDVPTSSTYLGWVDGDLYLADNNNYPLAEIYRRSAGGTWEKVGNDIPAQVNDLAMYNSQLYAATLQGLYALENGVWTSVPVYEYTQSSPEGMDSKFPVAAQSFSTLTSTQEDISINTILVNAGEIYIGTSSPRGVYKSPDGIHWTAIDVGLTGAYTLTVTKLLASESGTIFAATIEDGVFMSTNGGERWQALDKGFPHTITNYGVLLHNVGANSIIILNDGPSQQTLAAVINSNRVWQTDVNNYTWLVDEPPRVPPKAVLVVGPVDPPEHLGTKSYIEWSDRLAAIMEKNGMEVVKVYWPDSTWENVRAAIGGASIVVYKGHGFSGGEPSDDPTEFFGGVNGFTLVNTTDPDGAILGTQDMLVTTNRLAENAIGFFFCCFCGGSAANDTSPIPENWARFRIEGYSSTVFRMGGKGYFSGVDEEEILKAFFANPDKPLGEIFKDIQGNPEHLYQHILSPDWSVWFDGNSQNGWGEAFAGDSNLTPRQVMGR